MHTLSSKISITLTLNAANKIKSLILPEQRQILKFRIFIIGGGCNGFQYQFKLDDTVHKHDCIIDTLGISIIVDKISIQYISGSCIDYIDNLNESKFKVNNPQAKITCNCGSSFDI
ncbi:iron-sulfur cluster insertion protein ErpA [Enterobacteriaceae endosymbiont of Macroplea mutica]|uniref:iron-sulfur cluster insertion protein ErpA n=1 Tax=Enterobacteriaceae endosymbiont of Macroplea mutica TaxID=2675791 RepID=UPI001448F2B0|nr:iron-sulfur cluster insertion protein ErpA [Enterobacteriaceae endosymbiont of Macroplea mutica]QJC31104.1 iron-sulfur cluster insertion protein ErpA [Enterobacteriaceae endosymbiont of Macroplea mutica]